MRKSKRYSEVKRYNVFIGLEPTWLLCSLSSFLNVFIGLSRTHDSFHLDPSDWEANVSVMLWSRRFPAKFYQKRTRSVAGSPIILIEFLDQEMAYTQETFQHNRSERSPYMQRREARHPLPPLEVNEGPERTFLLLM